MADKSPEDHQEFLETMRQELRRRQKELQDGVNSSLEELRDEGHHLSDMEDLASDARDDATTFEIMAVEQAELEQVDHALELIDEGSYGDCEECGETINLERLQALPFATLCIDCKREEEEAAAFEE